MESFRLCHEFSAKVTCFMSVHSKGPFGNFETEGIEMPGGANSDVSHTCHNNAAIYEIS